MAKRGKGGEPEEKEEGYEFVPPDFDEDTFIHKEMVSFRTTSTLIVVGILAAVISWAIFTPVGGADAGWWIGLVVLVVSFLALKPLYKLLKFDISHYGRREWLGTGFLMFFTWLAFFMILLNPPFSDHAEPQVDLIASPNTVADGDLARIDLFAADNDKVTSRTFRVTDASGTVLATKDDLIRIDHDQYRYEATLPLGTYKVTATAKDPAGHEGSDEITLNVVPQVIRVFPATGMDLTDPTKEILITVPDSLDVWSAYADFDGDRMTVDDRVYFEFEEKKSGFVVTAAHKGWNAGSNNFTIIVEERNVFHGQTLVPGAAHIAGPFDIQVDNPGSYNAKAAKGVQGTTPPSVQVPGLELPILLAGLVATALVVRRRK